MSGVLGHSSCMMKYLYCCTPQLVCSWCPAPPKNLTYFDISRKPPKYHRYLGDFQVVSTDLEQSLIFNLRTKIQVHTRWPKKGANHPQKIGIWLEIFGLKLWWAGCFPVISMDVKCFGACIPVWWNTYFAAHQCWCPVDVLHPPKIWHMLISPENHQNVTDI